MTIHLVGVIHTDPDSEWLVRDVITSVKPDIVFLELGEYRLGLLQNDSTMDNVINRLKTRSSLRLRGRIIAQMINIRYIISAIQDGVIVGEVDMIPAIESANQVGASIIPIDMEQYQIMNKLGRSMFSIDALISFNLRERLEFIREFDLDSKTASNETFRQLEMFMQEIAPARYRVLVTERNNFMIENIQQHMNNKIAVAILGALHVPGIKEKLESKGYNVEVHYE